MGKITIREDGAAEHVGGSKVLLNTPGFKALIDVGEDYDSEDRSITKTEKSEYKFPYDPTSIDSVVLTHAHADHIGKVLEFIKQGFNKQIYSTFETAEIAKIQFSQQVNGPHIYNRMIKGKKFLTGPRKGQFVPFKHAEFEYGDIKNAMDMFATEDEEQKGLPYKKPIKLSKNINMTFYDAGHIPGSAQILFEIQNGNKKINLLTTGDLGRTDYKIINHPVADIPIVRFPETKFPKKIDYIIIEATYGDKVHAPLADSLKILEEAVKDAYKKESKIVIPAFSIMRTHMLWNFLYDLNDEGRLPKDMMIYSSSPMADEVSKVILRHMEDFDKTALKNFQDHNNNPFYFNQLVHHAKSADTKAELDKAGAAGFIASSGMCEFGRIVTVLEKTITDPKNIILITGYQAPGTRGYHILNKDPEIMFTDQTLPLKADVRKMGGLSGHADSLEMIAHLKNINNPSKGAQFKGIYIKHGEKSACHNLAKKVIDAGYNPETVHVMKKGEEYILE